MPRRLSESERQRVLERLHTRGRDRFVRLGLAKTTVAGLAQDAAIGKGSFYQFYDSKEELFVAISQEEERRFKLGLVNELEGVESGRTAISLLLRGFARRMEEHPFLRFLLDASTLASLTLKVDAEILERNQADDKDFFMELARDWQTRGWLRRDIDPNEVFNVLAGVFLMTSQRSLVGPEVVEGALEAISLAFCQRWMP